MTRWISGSLIVAVLFASSPRDAFAQDPHAGHQSASKPEPKPAAKPPVEDHSVHAAAEQPREPIPPLTDADRAAAFPPNLEGHAVHDSRPRAFVLFDQLEWQGGAEGGPTLEYASWFGGDLNRLWIRAEAESEDRRIESGFADVLYGRSIARWWDLVAGVRRDVRPTPARTWVAFGIQGLAPYWFEVQATGYVGAGGRTHARLEVEYELLFTNRLILQPLVEVEMYGKDDPERGLGAGLSTLETGLRLRYEIRRELAPYIGLTWERKLFGTADYARGEGDKIGAARLALGLRTWF